MDKVIRNYTETPEDESEVTIVPEQEIKMFYDYNVPGFLSNDLDNQDEEFSYIGKENNEGRWIVLRIQKTGGVTKFRVASLNENREQKDYLDAWSNKKDLTYGYFKDNI